MEGGLTVSVGESGPRGRRRMGRTSRAGPSTNNGLLVLKLWWITITTPFDVLVVAH